MATLERLRLAAFKLLGLVVEVILGAIFGIASILISVNMLAVSLFVDIELYTSWWGLYLPDVPKTWDNFLRAMDIFAGQILSVMLCYIVVVVLLKLFFPKIYARELDLILFFAVVTLFSIYAEWNGWITHKKTVFFFTQIVVNMESPVRLTLIWYRLANLLTSLGITEVLGKIIGAIAFFGSLYEGVSLFVKFGNYKKRANGHR
jgi:hypothetical protein